MFFNVSIFILFYRLAAFRTPPGQNFEGTGNRSRDWVSHFEEAERQVLDSHFEGGSLPDSHFKGINWSLWNVIGWYRLEPLGGIVLVGTFGQNSIGWDLLGRIVSNFTNVFSFYNLWLPGCFLNGTSKLFVGIEPTGTMSKPLTTNSREKSKLALVFSTEI
ncbi:hypothetical protein RhiirA5_435926 [Rhizophagus irregularis]|uniref:Uncharacterized protein n=1 Tax=Rhizophagus irregularis TaxID=588596 RepID=A0A2N0NMP7_9GLOM|nr:hypothetical protein RhiirA5_435926 [Rhizophagus irregularis]